MSETFGTRLQAAMARHLARELDVPPELVEAWLEGRRVPSLHSLTGIVMALDLDEEEAFGLSSAAAKAGKVDPTNDDNPTPHERE